MPDISLSFTSSAFIVLLLVLIAVAISILFYRRTVPPVPPAKRYLLIALRAAALSLLLIFLFEPLLRLITTSTQKPVLAVLVDNSKSMTINDNAGDRLAQARSILSNNALREASGKGEVRYYAFGTRTKQNEETDSLRFDDDATDMIAALRMVAEEKERLNIGAVVMLTDGSYNLGQNPVYEAEHLGIPLFTIGVGDSTEQKDVLITKIVTNDLVYNETEVPVDVTIKSSGYANEKVEVILSDGTRELGRTQVVLQEGTREYSVRLTYTPEGEGVKRYTVRISQLPGELTTANNQRTFLARILKSKLRVLLLAGTPSPDLSIVKQTLSEDRNIDVLSLTHKSPSVFYERPLTSQLLDSSDCIVLIGFPIAGVADATMEMTRASIERKATPLFFINGRSVDSRKLAPLSPLLPFSDANPVQNEQLVFIEPAAAQRNHPILATNTEEGIASWSRLPPIYRLQTAYRIKSEATVLATVKINNIVLNEPLIAIRSVNRQKSMAILGYGIWRWRLMAQGNPQTEKLFATFLSNSIRWLSTRDDSRPVKVTPLKPEFSQGEPVEFVGQVYDASANPVENAQVKVAAEHEGKQFETTLRPIGNGRYEGTLEGLDKGDYTFKSVATIDGQALGEDRGRFTVGELDLEFQDTRMNVQLLRQLAARTNGEFLLPSQISGLPSRINSLASFAPREVHDAREFELWNWKYMLALVVLLFAVEWFVRKRSGML
ncbi:MAG: hypothetical protein KF749_05720 [Bacteroidetes bacterium]|nr:hypothetical protein [Bacteroidota bacterium]MCW5894718.1 hypothetical protein [Bacteroidota bacterium]